MTPQHPSVLVEAVPFCFGPASTGLAICQELRDRSWEVIWIATSTTLELLKASGWQGEIIEVDEHAAGTRHTVQQLCTDVNGILVITDPEFAIWILKGGISKVAYVDILFWMWDDIDKLLLERTTPYIIEKFDGLQEQYDRVGKPQYAVEVGPLINCCYNNDIAVQEKDLLLISLGGVGNPIAIKDDISYPLEILSVLAPIILESDFKNVAICGGQLPPRDSVKGLDPNWTYGAVGQEEHGVLLQAAAAAMLSPGLTVFFEWQTTQTPALFLPPQNYSQVLQLRRFAQLGATDGTTSFAGLGIECSVELYQSEETAVHEVRLALKRLFHSTYSRRTLQDRIARFLNEVRIDHSSYLPQQDLRGRWGMHGAKEAADAIIKALSK